MAHFPEKFGFCVTRIDAGGRSGAGQGGSGGESLSLALQQAFFAACFYMGVEGCKVEITAHCVACGGQGVVGASVRRRGGKCKACKGVGSREVASYVAEPPKECEIWRHGERVSAPQSELDRLEARENRERPKLDRQILKALEGGDFSEMGLAQRLSGLVLGCGALEKAIGPALRGLVARGEVVTWETTDPSGTHTWHRLAKFGSRVG